MKWFVLYTKPNFEIKVAQAINSIGINAYCPVYKQIKQYSDRKKKIIKPLIPSYIFLKLPEKDRNKVFTIPGVVRYLFWLGKPAQVIDEEIELLKGNLNEAYSEVVISKLTKGSAYTIPSGPLVGRTGRVLNVFKNKLRLELSSLGILVTLSRGAA
jgi:transcription antitermination factor NusG